MSFKWSLEAETALLDFYRDHEELWQPKHEDYFKRYVREALMETICAKLSLMMQRKVTIKEAKEKFRNLRTSYNRERKKMQISKKTGAPSSCVYISKWAHLKNMDFLDDINLDNEIDMLSTQIEVDLTEISNSSFPTIEMNELSVQDNNETEESLDEGTEEQNGTQQKKIHKKQEQLLRLKLINQTSKFLSTATDSLQAYCKCRLDPNGISAFAESVAATLNKLDPVSLEDAKLEIQQILCKYIRTCKNS
ncbi:uncharacterized protein [Centruroides vittatus]|uniref:uncharacterized protein n=1 Tax=Centruroides vittatus TaxID=120091 RepID=UPI003510A94B